MNKERVFEMMQESLNSLKRAEVLEHQIEVDPTTVLLGTGSLLDSMAFVGFVTDMEDRLADETGEEYYLLLDELHEFNADEPYLSAEVLANFIVKLLAK